MAARDLRPLRVLAALFGTGSAIPLGYALGVLLVDVLRHRGNKGFFVDLAFVIGLCVAGPLAVLVTSALFALRVRLAGGFHLASLGIAGILGVFAAGLFAIGGGSKEVWPFLLAAPLGILSVALTIVVIAQDRPPIGAPAR